MGHDDHDRGQRRGCDPEQEISLLESKRLATILGGIHGELQSIRTLLTDQNQHLERGFKAMSQEMDDLEREVGETKTVLKSAVVLIRGMSARILELKNDPVKLAAWAAELNTDANDLAAAITENTPAEGDPNVPVDPNNPNAPQFASGKNPNTDAQLAQFMAQNPKATPAQIESFRTSRTGASQFNQPFDSSSPTRTPPTDAELADFKTRNPNATPEQINQFRMLPR